jgi:hypothetical protein
MVEVWQLQALTLLTVLPTEPEWTLAQVRVPSVDTGATILA